MRTTIAVLLAVAAIALATGPSAAAADPPTLAPSQMAQTSTAPTTWTYAYQGSRQVYPSEHAGGSFQSVTTSGTGQWDLFQADDTRGALNAQMFGRWSHANFTPYERGHFSDGGRTVTFQDRVASSQAFMVFRLTVVDVNTLSGQFATCGPDAFTAPPATDDGSTPKYDEGTFTLARGTTAPPLPASAGDSQYGVLGRVGGESPLCGAARADAELWNTTPPTAADTADTRRGTVTSVGCDRGPNDGDPFRCTATVADSDARDGASTPTGNVGFATTHGSYGPDHCVLAPSLPNTATCAVTYLNPDAHAGDTLPVTAQYEGDANHRPSRGAHTLNGDAPVKPIPTVPDTPTPPSILPAPDPGDTRRKTLSLLQCDTGPVAAAYADIVCNVQVADAAGDGRTMYPDGTVLFTSTGGTFVVGPRCVLARGQAGSNTAYCTVVFRPDQSVPTGTVVPVRATYLGTSVYQPSTAVPQLLTKKVKGYDDPVPATPQGALKTPVPTTDCSSAGSDSGSGSGAGGGRATTRLHQDNNANPNVNPQASSFTYYTQVCLYNTIGGVSRLVQGAGVIGGSVVAVSGVAVPIPGAQPLTIQASASAGTLIASTSIGAGQVVISYTDKWLDDPPRKDYKTATRIAKSRTIRVRAAGRVTAAQAKVLSSFATGQLRIAALARAGTIAVDRAGGAKAAGDTASRAKQEKVAVSTSTQLARQLDTAAALLPKVRIALRRVPQLARVPTLAQARKAVAKLRRGLPANLVAGLRATGFTAAERKTVAAGLKAAPAKRASLADALAAPAVAKEYRAAATALRRLASLPDVVAAEHP